MSNVHEFRKKLGVGSDTILSTVQPKPVVIEESFMDVLSQEGLFSPQDCAQIIAENCPTEWGHASLDDGVLDYDWRKTDTHFIQPDGTNAWLFDKLLAMCLKANERYQFNIDFFDAVQIARYREGHFYNWHFDAGPGKLGNRKLSATLQLSATDDYKGGDLILDINDFHAPREIGSVTLFPSFIKHRVSPILSGTRYSLVIWCSGTERFK